MREARTELVTPAPNRLVTDNYTALEQYLFDVTKAELKPEIPAHGATDDCGGKAMTVIQRFCFLHRAILRDHLANVTEPYQYLIALFNGLPHAHTAGDYEALLPWRFNQHAA